MSNISSFFSLESMALLIPVIVLGLLFFILGVGFIVEKLMPWKEIDSKNSFSSDWARDERRLLDKRRSEDRQIRAREAVLSGGLVNSVSFGRRRSDFEDIGLIYPGDRRVQLVENEFIGKTKDMSL
jgi:hypothetical protein